MGDWACTGALTDKFTYCFKSDNPKIYLQNLSLIGSEITNASIINLSSIEGLNTSLITLKLDFCQNLTDDCLKSICKFKNLRHLSMNGCRNLNLCNLPEFFKNLDFKCEMSGL